MIPKIAGVPSYLRAIPAAINPIADIVNKGLVVNSDSVISQRQPDGRVRLRLSSNIQTGNAAAVNNLYISFRANIHDASDDSELIHIGFGDTNYIGAFYDIFLNTFEFFGVNDPAFIFSEQGTFALNTFHTLEMRVAIKSGIATVMPSVNGTQFSNFTIPLSISTLRFGAYFSGAANNHQLDDLKIGTTGFGSSDIFSADFTSAIVPPFDSTTGTGLSISAGTLLVSNAGTDAYAVKAISFP